MPTLTKSVNPLAQQLVEAIAETDAPRANGNRNRDAGRALAGAGNGNGNGKANGREQARRVATKVGRGMLAASNRETARHSDDVVVISRAICDLLQIRGVERQDLLAAARLHDIGKAAIPNEILEKQGPLTSDEWDLIRTHTDVGAEILASVKELEGIALLVRHSHERWDGKGYPSGLAGEEIPLGSRIIFCADAFHAIRSDRPYRSGRPAVEALAELRANSGTQFDPNLVEALDEVVRDLRLVSRPRRVRRSNRLMALLLCLTVGGTGSAIARSGLLGEPTAQATSPAPLTAAVCGPFDCTPLLSLSLADQLRHGKQPLAPGVGAPVASTGPAGSTESGGATDPGPTTGSDERNSSAAGPISEDSGSSGSGAEGSKGNSGGNGNGNANGHTKPENGNGNANGHDKQGSSGGGHGSGTTGGPGNSSGNPHGGPPGHSGGGSGGNPHGGPPGQAKKP